MAVQRPQAGATISICLLRDSRLVLLVVVLAVCLMVVREFLSWIVAMAAIVSAMAVGWFSCSTFDVVRPRTTDKQGFEGVQLLPLFYLD